MYFKQKPFVTTKNNILMKKTITIALLLLLCKLSAQTKEVGQFFDVKVFDGISAKLIKSSENKVIISGDDADKVSVVNKNGILKIRMQIDKIFSGYKTFVEVHYSGRLDVIDANENALIESAETIKQTDVELKSQEGGEINLSLDVQKLTVKAVTGGKLGLKGSAKTQDVTINTGGHYEADTLKTEQTVANVSTGGAAFINASEYMEAKVKAGGSIYIYGNPKVIDKQTFLGGRIIEQ